MEEMQEIKARLTSLEATIAVSEDYAKSLKAVLFHIAEALHRKGVLPMQELAQMVEASDAFSRGAFGREKKVMVQPMADSLRQIGDAIDALPPSQSQA